MQGRFAIELLWIEVDYRDAMRSDELFRFEPAGEAEQSPYLRDTEDAFLKAVKSRAIASLEVAQQISPLAFQSGLDVVRDFNR